MEELIKVNKYLNMLLELGSKFIITFFDKAVFVRAVTNTNYLKCISIQISYSLMIAFVTFMNLIN